MIFWDAPPINPPNKCADCIYEVDCYAHDGCPCFADLAPDEANQALEELRAKNGKS